tara:strand:+ start:96 stop:698 length:603 start_codon:yes stop_codon:yes gene_type:complete
MEYSLSTLKTNTIQAATGSSVNITSGHKLTGAAGSIVAPGQVLQVVQGSMGDRLAIATGGNFTKITGLEASITPSSTSSKILVQPNLSIAGHGSYYTVGIRLYVNDAHITDASAADGTYGSNDKGCFMCVCAQLWSNYIRYQASGQYLHSPNSTSQQTYSVYVTDQRDNSTVYINRYHYETNANYMHTTKSTITVMEIAG